MVSFDTVLVPTDGSEGASVGVRRSIELARVTDADLHFLAVIDTTELSGGDEVTESGDIREGAQSVLDDATALVKEHAPDLHVETSVEVGRPFEKITAYAEMHDADVIAMGTRGRSGLKRFLLGSTTEKVLRTASRPVLAVPPAVDTEAIRQDPCQSILHPTDGSRGSDAALPWAIEMTDMVDGTFHTLFAADTGLISWAEESADVYRYLEESGEEILEMVRHEAVDAGLSVRGTLASGSPAKVILEYAEEEAIDMIVMGTHGRGGVERALVGSVTENVIRGSSVPVMAVPLDGGT